MKIRFVIPWYGENIPGGAEYACRRTAENLHDHGFDVEVLTTCAKDCYGWDNHHKPGVTKVNSVAVRRFLADERNPNKFDEINSKLMNGLSISDDEESTFISEMINSTSLYDFIAANKDGFYFFMPYMFGTTFHGSLIHPEISYIIPCLHDESYAYLNIFKKMFEQVKGVISLAHDEQKLTQAIYGIAAEKTRLLGVGVDTEIKGDRYRFRKKFDINDPFILYVGRKERGKNVDLLIDYFSKYKKVDKDNLKLVLVGGGSVDIPKSLETEVIDLGFVSDSDKYDAYAAATMHCQPSANESFSFTIMESWLLKTPVLVHSSCAVTKKHCVDSNGGLFFENAYEFIESLLYALNNKDTMRQMAENGSAYVKENYSWEVIIDKYKCLLESENENRPVFADSKQ